MSYLSSSLDMLVEPYYSIKLSSADPGAQGIRELFGSTQINRETNIFRYEFSNSEHGLSSKEYIGNPVAMLKFMDWIEGIPEEAQKRGRIDSSELEVSGGYHEKSVTARLEYSDAKNLQEESFTQSLTGEDETKTDFPVNGSLEARNLDHLRMSAREIVNLLEN